MATATKNAAAVALGRLGGLEGWQGAGGEDDGGGAERERTQSGAGAVGQGKKTGEKSLNDT